MEQIDLDLLQSVPPYHIQSIIKARHVSQTKKTSRSETSSGATSSLDEIAGTLFTPASIRETLASLDNLAARLLRELVRCGGRANSRDLALYFSYNVPEKANQEQDQPAREHIRVFVSAPLYPVAHPHGTFEQALHHLLLLGLLFWGKQTNFVDHDYASGIHDGVLIIPATVMREAQIIWKDEENPPAIPAMQEISEHLQPLQRSLYLYWSVVASSREGLALVNNGLLSRPALRYVIERTLGKNHNEPIRQENELPRLFFLRLLLMKLGLLRVQRNAVHAAPAEEFFALPMLERARRCYHLYLEAPFWNEMLYLPEVNIRPGPSPLDAAHEEVVRARHQVLECLLREPVGEWQGLPAFIAHCKLYMPNLLFPRQYGPRAERYSSGSNPYGWDFRLRRGWLTHREGWHMVEGGLIRAVIGGPLHWLGLVDVDNEEQPGKFRLMPAASMLTSDVSEDGAETGWGRLVVQPNFELVALAPVSEVLLIKLDRFADRTSLEHIAQYRLTKASVTRAIQRGMHVDQVIRELEQAAGSEIPQNVRYSLHEWERQARRVEVWPGVTLLEVDDEQILDDLLASTETLNLFKRRLSPRLIEVAPQQLEAVQQLLWQRQFLPAHSVAQASELATAQEPQWRLHADGLLQPLYGVGDLYFVAELTRFTALDEPSGWRRVTASSLQQALNQEMSLDHIIQFLQHYCVDGIPGSLLIRLKLWGGGYGVQRRITVERAPLLRLPEQVLRDLQTDEELAPLLGSEIEQTSRLIHIDESSLSDVLKLLRERGFDLEE